MKRKFAGYEFEHVGEIEPERDARGDVVPHLPDVGQGKQLHRYGLGPFCRFRIAKGWSCGGVYVIECKGLVCYVGKCHDLEKIWYRIGRISPSARYERGQQTHCMNNGLIFNEVVQGGKVNVWFCAIEDEEMRLTAKDHVIQKCEPSWNLKR